MPAERLAQATETMRMNYVQMMKPNLLRVPGVNHFTARRATIAGEQPDLFRIFPRNPILVVCGIRPVLHVVEFKSRLKKDAIGWPPVKD